MELNFIASIVDADSWKKERKLEGKGNNDERIIKEQ